MTILVIVESPSKCKKIEEYLGKDIKCIASYGHVRKLPGLKNIDVNNFKLNFEAINSSYLKKLEYNINNSSEIIIATDDDREGEAIGYHICCLFKLPLTIKRIKFNEITCQAVKNAYDNPTTLNMNLIHAAITRQVLDLLVGFTISPFLWRNINHKKNLSAGRCQTPALRLVYDNFLKIKNNPGNIVHKIIGYFTNKNIEFTLNQSLQNPDTFLEQSITFKHIFKRNIPTEVVKKSPKPFSTSYLRAQFKTIIDMAGDGCPENVPAVGAMCGADRDAWASARARMVADPSNQEFLDAVQSAIFCVCLDSSAPVTRTETARALWHGDSKERWYDKSVQIIVFENGKAGLMGEHSNYDGQPAVGLSDFLLTHEREKLTVFENANPQEKVAEFASNGGIPPRNISTLLHFDMAMNWDLNNAIAEFTQTIEKHDLTVLPFYGCGKTIIKSFKCSPDAFAQMAIQIAYRRMFGECRATYEPFSMRAYRHGRTETIRSVSVDSQHMCDVMDDRTKSAAERAEAIRTACSAHGAYIKNAASGNACDRHLMGLSMLVGDNEKTPSIFTDPLYWKSKTWHLSTSNLSHELFDGWGWGEVVPDGLGIAYSTNQDMLLYNVTSARGFTAQFCQHLENALRDMMSTMMAAESKL